MLIIADLLSTIMQSILVGYIPYYCLKRDKLGKKEANILKLIFSTILIFISVEYLTIKIGATSLAAITMNIMNILIIGCFYFKVYNKAIISYSLIYFIFQIVATIFSNIHWSYIQGLISIENAELSTIIVMYIPMYIVQLCIFISKDKIYKVYKFISRKKYSFEILLLVIFSFDCILSLSFLIHGNDNTFFKNIFIMTLIIFVVIVSIYFINLKNKMYEIDRLNKSLHEMNDELRKIQHDYGSQISYINGLYIMEQYERLGQVLRGIINGNNNISDNIKVFSDTDSIISVTLNSLITKDVNVIIEEEIDISELEISEYELQKIISNIVSNAITAMDGRGLIVIKTYKIFSSIYINIKNNGPKISDNIIDNIFEPGFTTKGKKDNGFGLAIVKELVEKNNGTISVSSNSDYTEFKIIFKVK